MQGGFVPYAAHARGRGMHSVGHEKQTYPTLKQPLMVICEMDEGLKSMWLKNEEDYL